MSRPDTLMVRNNKVLGGTAREAHIMHVLSTQVLML